MAIDHDQRRRRIAEITIDLVARDGLGAATIRGIAAEAGFSTAAITHYFADKHELLVWAFEHLAMVGEQEFARARTDDPTDIIGALLTMVAWCPQNVKRWKAYLAFWDQGSRDAHLGRQIAASTEAGLELIEQAIRQGSAVESRDVAKAARLLNSIIQGLSMQAIVAPRQWAPDQARQLLQEAVDFALAGPWSRSAISHT